MAWQTEVIPTEPQTSHSIGIGVMTLVGMCAVPEPCCRAGWLKRSLVALEQDYTAMLEDGLLALNQPSFTEIIDQCRVIQDEANRQAQIASAAGR